MIMFRETKRAGIFLQNFEEHISRTKSEIYKNPYFAFIITVAFIVLAVVKFNLLLTHLSFH